MRLRFLFAAALVLVSSACHKDATQGLDGQPQAANTLEFGLVPVNGRHTLALEISNIGPLAFSVQDSQAQEPFLVTGLPQDPLSPGESDNAYIAFSPIAAGDLTSTVVINDSSVSAPQISVKVHGIAYIPLVSPSPDRLDFGNVTVGDMKTLSLTITNASPVPLTPELEATDPTSDFIIARPGFQPQLSPGASESVDVTFVPSSAGMKQTQLTLGCSTCQVQLVQTTGTGVAVIVPPPPVDAGTPIVDAGPDPVDAGPPPPEPLCTLVASPTSVDFGLVSPGANAHATITYTNAGTGPCIVLLPYLATGADPSINVDNLVPFTFAPGATQTFTAEFNPTTATGRQASAMLKAASNDKVNTLVTVSLQGETPTPPPPPGVLVVTPSSLTFNAQVPNAPPSQDLLLQNTGGSDLSFTASTDDGKITVGATSGSVLAGASTSLTVSVAADTVANHRVSHVTIDAGAAGMAVIPCDITFTAAPPPPNPGKLLVTPLTLSFSAEVNTAPASQSVTASNTGGVAFTWTATNDAADPNLSFAPTTDTLAAAQAEAVTVSVLPQAFTGTRTETITFSAGAAGSAVVTVKIEFHQTAPPPPPPQYGASVWPKFHHDNGNTGLSVIDTSATTGVPVFKTLLAPPAFCRQLSGVWRCGTYQASPSLGADGTIYQVGGDKNVYAVDRATGTVKWSYQIGEPMLASAESDITVVADGHFFVHVHSTGATVPQFFKIRDNVTVGVIDWQNTPEGLDSNGKRKDGFDSAPAIDYQGNLYLMNEDGSKVGTWNQTSAKTADAALTPLNVDGFTHGAALTTDRISFWTGNGVTWAIDETTATLLWDYSDPILTTYGGYYTYSKSAPMITSDGTLITSFAWRIGTAAPYTYETRINAWSAGKTKKALWSVVIGPTKHGPAKAPLNANVSPEEEIRYNLGVSSPAQGPDGTIYIGHADGLYAIDPVKKKVAWSVGTGPVTSSPAVGADGRVYFGSSDGNIYCAGKTATGGTILWSVPTGGQVNSSPAIGADGTIYAMSDDGYLYAVK